jgi:two-component system, chemotaxis family, chemotaxis protein CheY
LVKKNLRGAVGAATPVPSQGVLPRAVAPGRRTSSRLTRFSNRPCHHQANISHLSLCGGTGDYGARSFNAGAGGGRLCHHGPHHSQSPPAIGFADVDDANDGSTALAKMHEKRYGLVISDWNMEPMTGFELLREVRADPELGGTPFIMVTAESKTENVVAARKAGVNNYIVKPFNAQTLKSKIESVLADHR